MFAQLTFEVTQIQNNFFLALLDLKKHVYFFNEIRVIKEQLAILESSGNFFVQIIGITIVVLQSNWIDSDFNISILGILVNLLN